MSVGYIVIAHKLPNQLIKLIRVLTCSAESRVLVHLDRGGMHAFGSVLASLKSMPHVHVISRRNVYWGHITMVDTLLDCLRLMLDLYPDTTHMKQLSGQDYPIRPLSDFEQILQRSAECSFMEFRSIPNEVWIAGGEEDGGLDRVLFPHLRVGRHLLRIPVRRHIECDRLYGGSALWCLSRAHAAYILSQAESFRRLFRWSLSPDEMFFHTLLLNSPLAGQVINNGLTYVVWEHSAPSPKILSEGDLPAMQASGCWFARKFDIEAGAAVLEKIDHLLL